MSHCVYLALFCLKALYEWGEFKWKYRLKSGMKTCLLLKREKSYISLCGDHEYFSSSSILLNTAQHFHPRLHNTHTNTQKHTPTRISRLLTYRSKRRFCLSSKKQSRMNLRTKSGLRVLSMTSVLPNQKRNQKMCSEPRRIERPV